MKTKNTPFLNKPLLLKNLICSGFLATGLLFSSFSTFAANPKTSTLPISSTVSNSCVVKSTDSISLGSYNPSSLVNLNGSGILSLICTKGSVVTASPTSGGSSLTGSGGTLSYSLYTDSGMTSKWGAAGVQYVNLTGGTSATVYTEPSAYFSNNISISGHATLTQIQAAAPTFNSNTLYFYQYSSTSNTTNVAYGYLGQFSTKPTGSYGAEPYYSIVQTTSPQNIALNNGSYAISFIIPSGTITGTTSSLGTSYQVPNGVQTNPLTGTSMTVTQPLNLTYYASLPYGQDVAPGVYTDTVVIQVTF